MAGSNAGQPLLGKRVLVTRARTQSDAFADALMARGAEPVRAPAIVIEPPDDEGPARAAARDVAAYAWIVFTSQHGVDALFGYLAQSGADARALAGVNVAAVGERTAERLLEYGICADLVPETYVGEDLARALVERTQPGDRVLFYRAAQARDVAVNALREAGRDVTVVAAYKTTYAADPAYPAKVARTDVITFTSASTVRGFCAQLGGEADAAAAARGKLVACIGPIAAQAAREAGLQPDVVADVYTAPGLLDALEAFLARTP